MKQQMPHLLLDSNIILDYVIPYRRSMYACSYELVNRVGRGELSAWSADYALSETLGELKEEREKRIGVGHIFGDVLSPHEISQMVNMIREFTRTPNFEVFEPEPFPQEKIFEKIKDVCVQAKDAVVLLTALSLKKRLGNLILVTRDDRFLERARRIIQTAHPVTFISSCPTSCRSASTCRHRK